ncbi:helix-turn-helix domain-containing protein [Myxococcota bacterium]|nr:helix-turn-helix domain-containing protein [Myxococcota bacterium]
MDHELSELRRALADQGPRGPGRRVPCLLRERVVAAVRRRREDGVSVAKLAEALGLSVETLRRWLDAAVEGQRSAGRARPMPVAVIGGAAQGRGALSLVTPTGFRVEGLSVDTAAELLARLR